MPIILLFRVAVRFSDTLLEEFFFVVVRLTVEISLIWIPALRRQVDA